MSSVTEEIWQEGIQEGMIESQRNIAKKMFQKGMSVNEVAEFITKLDKDTLLTLREEALPI